MGKRTDTRERMVASAALLLREHGVQGTSVPKVLEHSGAPRGSVAHHFPGGKTELIQDAVSWAGGLATAALEASVNRGDSASETFSMMCAFYRQALVDTDFAAGCPVGAAAQTSSEDPIVRAAVKHSFDDWRRVMADSIGKSPRLRDQADDLAVVCVASIEGALLIVQADRSTDALDRVERQITFLLERGPA